MTDKMESNKVCKRCGKPLSKNEQSTDAKDLYCRQCRIELDEEHITNNDVIPSKPRPTQNKILKIAKWVLLGICIGVIIMNSVILVKVLLPPGSEKFSAPEISKDAVLCITNLMEISELLQTGRLPPDSIVCPLSVEPYRVEFRNGDTIVLCPNPDKHQLRRLSVSAKNKVPEVLK